MTKMIGTVIRMYPNKGFGFVRGSDRITRFMHVSAFVNRVEFDTLSEGQRVRFTPVMDEATDIQRGNGLRAVDVEVVVDS